MTVIIDKRVDVPSVDRPNVVYHVKAPSVGERATFTAALIAEGGQGVSKEALLDGLAEGIRALMPDEADAEGREEKLAIIETYRSQIQKAKTVYEHSDKGVKAREAMLKAFATPDDVQGLEAIVSEHYKPYRVLMGEMAVYPQRIGIVAARMFLMGWSGLNEPFSRKLGRVQDETLEPISASDLVAIGEAVQELMYPSKADLGNSPSDAGGQGDTTPSPDTSTVTKPTPTKKAAGTAKS